MQVPAPRNADKIPNCAGALLTCIKLHLSSTAPAKTVTRYSYLVVAGNEFSHQSLVLMASAINWNQKVEKLPYIEQSSKNMQKCAVKKGLPHTSTIYDFKEP